MKKIIFVAAILTALGGCEPSNSTSRQNAQSVENNQQRLQAVQPAPQLQVSLERANLIEQLERINQQNMSGYIYLVSQGSVMASYPVRGKVTSLNAYLMAGEKVGGGGTPGYYSVEQPDYDGAYGKNAEGVFFFTADTNAYVEWAGEYLFSDQPLSLNTQPRLERQVQ